ncbi:hypothetical protein ACFYYN_05445 [Streptomyces sp. NPDC001902]
MRHREQERALPVLAAGEGGVEGGERGGQFGDLGRAVVRQGEPALAGGEAVGGAGRRGQGTGQAPGQQGTGCPRPGQTGGQGQCEGAADAGGGVVDRGEGLGEHHRAAARGRMALHQHGTPAEGGRRRRRVPAAQRREHGRGDGGRRRPGRRTVRRDHRELDAVRPGQPLLAFEQQGRQRRGTAEHVGLPCEPVALLRLGGRADRVPRRQPGQQHRDGRHGGGEQHEVPGERTARGHAGAERGGAAL